MRLTIDIPEDFATLHVPPEVWNEVTNVPKPFGTTEAPQARDAGWLMVQTPASLSAVRALPFNLQPGETEALELAGALLLVDDAQGRRELRRLLPCPALLIILLGARETLAFANLVHEGGDTITSDVRPFLQSFRHVLGEPPDTGCEFRERFRLAIAAGHIDVAA